MTINHAINNIWLQLGTRAHMLVYRPLTNSWQIWTATNTRTGNSDLWLGTYMEVFPNGQCIQHIRTASEVRELEIRPPVDMQVQHIDGNVNNNDISNLMLVNVKENRR